MFLELSLTCLVASLVYMSLWFGLALARRQINVVDAAWPGALVLIALIVAGLHSSARSFLIAALVIIWGLRLFGHLIDRVFEAGEDRRYAEMVQNWHKLRWLRIYGAVFLAQAVLAVVVALPVIMATGQQNPHLGILSFVGALVWVVGLFIEAAADYQLRVFVRTKTSKDEVMEQGLWRYSRHPNYFGELLQWWGIGVIALQASFGWVGLFGPLVLTLSICFVSGIPAAEKRLKSNKNYQAYAKRTSPLVPLPPKKA